MRGAYPFYNPFSEALHSLRSITEYTETNLPGEIAALGEKILTLIQKQETP